jgi:hypothetical protein
MAEEPQLVRLQLGVAQFVTPDETLFLHQK